MPTYEYECTKCGCIFEKFQHITEPIQKECPKCKGFVKRNISGGAGIIFKGSGFYATDYRSQSYKEALKKDSPKDNIKNKPDSTQQKEKPK